MFTPQVENEACEDLKRRIAVQTAVWLHSVIEINKAAQLLSPVFRTVKQLFLMPHLHQGADNPFRLTVGLRTGNLGKLLTNPVLITGYTESMVGRAFIFRTVVGVNALNQVWTGSIRCSVRNLAALSAVLSGKMAAYSSLEKSSMAKTGNSAYRWLSAL